MNLPNIHFEDFPIEFKQINSEDFPDFNVEEKIIISPDKKTGYIYEKLIPHLDLDQKETVIINAQVGSGKSYAIIKTIQKIYNEYPNSLIIVATPFVSLVEQYVNDIELDAQISKDDIYDYSKLGRDFSINYLDRRVQVLTVNTLLGNPGEDGFKNSDIKRTYLNRLLQKCENLDSEVFFIYDEIHDAIQNFKEEFIFNLWKWRNVIHKNFIISATYSEASKVVIKHLGELTDRKLKIIESNRIRFPQKQSKLFLYYSPEHNFKVTTTEIVNAVDDLLKRDRNIDILCYSKNLAQSIIKDKEGIGKKLKSKFGEINDCTSELISNQRAKNDSATNRYDNEKCNVGTNFKTGVSIRKENHAYVIIMPPRVTRLWFRNKYGIFSGGVNSIIQAIARQRTKGEIHIILPRPDRFDIESLRWNRLINDIQRKAFKEWYSLLDYYDEKEDIVRYFPLEIQDVLLRLFYDEELKKNVEKEIDHVKGLPRRDLPRLEFPPYENFKLDVGEDYIANTYKIFGGDLSAYITYCAFTNQFINCRLTEIQYKTTLFFKEGKLQENLRYYFNKYFGEGYYNSRIIFSNFNMFYTDLRNELFSQFDMKYKAIGEKKKWMQINPYNNKSFENQLLRFCGIMFYHKNYYHVEDYKNKSTDLEHSRAAYFMDSISIANSVNLDESSYSSNNHKKIKTYQDLGYFREKLIQKIGHSSRGNGFDYLPVKPVEGFIEESEIAKFNETIDGLIEYDDLIKNEVFNFKRNFVNKTIEKKIESFYTILVDDFFELKKVEEYPKLTLDGRRRNVKPINSIKELPNSSKIIDLVSPVDYDQNYMDYMEKEAIKEYGSLETYNELIKSLRVKGDE